MTGMGPPQPGLLYTLTIRTGDGPTRWDRCIPTVSHLIRDVARRHHISTVDISPNVPIKGESWEMAFIMCIVKPGGVYSGTLDRVQNNIAYFGPVPGVAIKRTLSQNLTTNIELSQVLLPNA